MLSCYLIVLNNQHITSHKNSHVYIFYMCIRETKDFQCQLCEINESAHKKKLYLMKRFIYELITLERMIMIMILVKK
jgi:hypothetical protein